MRRKAFTPLDKSMRQDKFHYLTGFTLMELMLAVAILAIALVGLLATYIGCLGLNETSKNYTLAINAVQNKLEEIRNSTFTQICNNYNNTTFTLDGMTSQDTKGLIEVAVREPAGCTCASCLNYDLLEVTVTACWRQGGGRIIGGDGSLNPLPSSPVRVVTLMAQR